MANKIEPGAMRRSISVVTAPVPMPSSTMTRALVKSIGRNRADARDLELGNNDAVTDSDFNDSRKKKPRPAWAPGRIWMVSSLVTDLE